MPSWNPAQYLKFAEERSRPCRDLASRISVSDVKRIIDLGCGPGNSTEILAQFWPNAEIIGLDGSAQMIESARASQPGWKWMVGDISEWAAGGAGGAGESVAGERFDIVFSNAAIQWVPDHAVVLPQLLARVSPGGALAIQVPGNFDAPAHLLMREMAASPTWQPLFPLSRIKEWHVRDLAFYYDVLAPHAAHVDFWETEYLHVMPSAEGIVEWYKGTGMRPFLDALETNEDRERFESEYLDGIRTAYPCRPDTKVLFPFRRLFLIAYARSSGEK
jgi:trans-aconitate 2-methyltransferase